MARVRKKIQYCYEAYMAHLPQEEKDEYQRKYAPLVTIIMEGKGDKDVLARAKEHDAEAGTELFAEAVHLTVYCIACHEFDCSC